MIPNMDWRLLREQKDQVRDVIDTLSQELSDIQYDSGNGERRAALTKQIESLRGILHLIDYIQDKAAQDGEQVYEEEPARKERLYQICVTRTYSASETFEVVSDSEAAAIEEAEAISGDKDYSGKLQLVDVDVDIVSEEIV